MYLTSGKRWCGETEIGRNKQVCLVQRRAIPGTWVYKRHAAGVGSRVPGCWLSLRKPHAQAFAALVSPGMPFLLLLLLPKLSLPIRSSRSLPKGPLGTELTGLCLPHWTWSPSASPKDTPYNRRRGRSLEKPLPSDGEDCRPFSRKRSSSRASLDLLPLILQLSDEMSPPQGDLPCFILN